MTYHFFDLRSVASNDFDYAKIGRRGIIDDGTLASGGGSKGTDTYNDDEIIIYAPSGKLGLVIDNPDFGPPVIHNLKPDSVLVGQVLPGDRLVAVDEIDVRNVSSAQISELICERNDNLVRQLTLIRQRQDREMASNIASMSHIDTDGECDTSEFSDVVSLEEVGKYR